MGLVTDAITFDLKKQGERMVYVTWKNKTLWRGPTLKAGVTLSGVEQSDSLRSLLTEGIREETLPLSHCHTALSFPYTARDPSWVNQTGETASSLCKDIDRISPPLKCCRRLEG